MSILKELEIGRLLAYWKKQLADAPLALNLPTDRPRPATPTYQTGHQSLALSPSLFKSLERLSQQADVTLFMTLLAAFQTLLHRYTGRDDIVLGSPIAGRGQIETQELIGCLVNTLVLRTNLAGNPTFWQLVERVRETALGAYAHQDLPFEKLVEILQPDRDMSRSPLFQVLFNLENAPEQVTPIPGISINEFEFDRGITEFDLTLEIIAQGEKLTCWFGYRTDLFEAATITRMMGHFQTLLESISADPQKHISNLNFLTEAERQQILLDWNNAEVDNPRTESLVQRFEAQVERTPDAVALIFENQQLTYRDLNHQANQLAHHLQRLGIGPEVLIAMYTDRSVEMVVGILGILKAGGAYVPMDPAYPKERLAFMLTDTQAPVILTQQQLVGNLPEHAAQVICLDTDWAAINQESGENPISQVIADNLAYIIYTSGSTGKPKGVLVTHYNVVRLFEATQAWFHFDENDVWTLFHSYAFDFSVWELWGALIYGGRLIVVPYEVSRAAKAFYELLESERVTVLNQTPSAFRQLIWAEEDMTTRQALALRLVIFGGEALELQSLKPWFDRHGDQAPQLVNMYGITETTVHVTYRPLTATDLSTVSGSVIGVPIPDLELYILDKYLQLVPIGVSGEIYVGGAGVARGYLNRPELNEERFISNPFHNKPGARLYKSGDLARYLPNGDIEYLGRIDHQVKIRGFRIELGEIEACLNQHPAIQTAIVVAQAGDAAQKRLVAYLVAASTQAPSISELRSYLAERLPDYMLPSAFILLEALPLTPNGKVDRRALPLPDATRPQVAESYIPPRNSTEEALAAIWAEVLGLEQVGVYDNFFELGGHSLLATQVISRVRNTCQLELPLRTLFEAPTVAGSAERLEMVRIHSTLSTIAPVPRDKPLPLSFAQQRLWFLDQLESDSPLYNISRAVRLTGALDREGLQQALETIVARHETLRTTFITTEGNPAQVINNHLSMPLPIIDLSGLPERDREAEMLRLATEEAHRPFNLAADLMLRATVLRLGLEEHVLLLTLPHIAADGWSMGVLYRELSILYRAFCEERSVSLPPVPIQYADFAVWQREWLQDEVLAAQLAYWKQQLAGAPSALELPTDRPRPASQSYRGAQHPLTLSKSLSTKLKGLSQAEGVTLFMTLLAAFQVLLQRYSRQADILVGSPIANRNRAEIEELIGFFVNTLVLRGDLSGNPTFRELLVRVRELCVGAYAHQDLPFEKLVEKLQPERDPSRSPLFQVLFALQNTSTEVLELPGVTISHVETNQTTAKFDLSLTLFEREEELTGIFEYNTDLFDAATIERMAGHFQTLVEGIIANPEQRLSDLPILTEAEHHQLLVERNDTATDYARMDCVHKLFEAQVERAPEAIAITFEEQQLTYAELNRRANQLAHHLRALGVGPETLVSVCMERSIEMIIGLLGILKAGGAYVPLDPAYPQERLAFMLSDTAAPVVLSQQSLLAQLPPCQAQILCLDRDWQAIAQAKETNPTSDITLENLAYVIYTSGSTGQPKGVAIQHQGLINLINWHLQAYTVTPSDRATQLAGTAFDASVWEIWPYLAVGASLHLPSEAVRISLPDLIAWLAEKKISLTFLPTPLAEAALNTAWPADLSLRVLLTGGDMLRRWPPQNLPFELVNNYGPTENTVVTTWLPLSAGLTQYSLPPIGRPVTNTQVFILDHHLQPTPVGVPGELYIGGMSLARGYLNRPELTAEKFIPHPFSQEAGTRLYRTGDLVRYLPDGNIEFLGRIDHQVKLRGFRIELGEIEAALNRHPLVQETVVIIYEDPSRSKSIVAYLVADEAQTPTASDLRGFLKQTLPDYMIPAAFVRLDAIPLTPNGKADRRALPAPETLRPELEETFVPPRNPIEGMIAAIWAKVLGLEQVGVYDNFFELGGHSLLATQVISHLRHTFQFDLPLRSLFEAPTVAGLAERLEVIRWATQVSLSSDRMHQDDYEEIEL